MKKLILIAFSLLGFCAGQAAMADEICMHGDGPLHVDDRAPLRIERPIPQVFAAPEADETQSEWLSKDDVVFCPVLICHGTCRHREGPCRLRTFKNLLGGTPHDCCSDGRFNHN